MLLLYIVPVTTSPGYYLSMMPALALSLLPLYGGIALPPLLLKYIVPALAPPNTALILSELDWRRQDEERIN